MPEQLKKQTATDRYFKLFGELPPGMMSLADSIKSGLVPKITEEGAARKRLIDSGVITQAAADSQALKLGEYGTGRKSLTDWQLADKRVREGVGSAADSVKLGTRAREGKAVRPEDQQLDQITYAAKLMEMRNKLRKETAVGKIQAGVGTRGDSLVAAGRYEPTRRGGDAGKGKQRAIENAVLDYGTKLTGIQAQREALNDADIGMPESTKAAMTAALDAQERKYKDSLALAATAQKSGYTTIEDATADITEARTALSEFNYKVIELQGAGKDYQAAYKDAEEWFKKENHGYTVKQIQGIIDAFATGNR